MGDETDLGLEPRSAGIMDLAWERQQKKTFTAWCNSHLRKVGVQMKEINEDFRDGKWLISLLEVISGEKLPKPEKGRMRVHKVNNVQKALDFIASKGVRLAGIGAEEIVDGNLKMTLGMIWTVILRFAIQDISVEEMTAKEGLLLWCQRKTQPYKNVNVQNFHMSFKDGLAFCALIHRHRPDLIDYDSLRKDDPMHNLNTAFEVAEKYLDIPKMLDAEDMVNQVKPDERAVMTYVSAYYHAFASGQQAEMAGKRIGKVLDINKENERLMEEYENLASELLAWIERTIQEQSDRSQANTLEATRSRLQDFRNYRSEQKPPKAEEKGRLETHFNTLQTKLRISNRPAYMPSEGKMIHDITVAWKNLEKSEKDYEEFLMAEIRRLERLEHLAAKFTHKAAIHESWTAGKEDMLAADDLEDVTLAGVLAMKKQHEAFESDLAAHEDRIEQLQQIAQELASLGYFGADQTNASMQAMMEQWELLRSLSEQRMSRLQEAEQLQMKLDELRLDFAKKAAPFNNWMDSAKEELLDVFSVHSVQEVQDLLDGHSSFKAGLESAKGEYEELFGLQEEVNRLGGGGPNPYTNLTFEDIKQKWDEMAEFVPQRDQTLSDELARQQRHEELRQSFAAKANEVGPWLEQETEYLATLGLQSTGTLEDNLAQLHQEETKVADYKSHMEELEAASHVVHEELVFDNPYTVYSMDTLRVQYQQLKSAISRSINAVENQILTRDSMGITEDQLQEFRQSFNHFDKDGSGELDRNEFKACLLSMGQNLGDDDSLLNEFMAKVDPNETGRVTFDSYLNFMTRQATDEDSVEQVLASFKILAGEKPYITPDQLRAELPDHQAEYCISRMSPYTGPGAPEGALDYQSFATALYGQSDL